MDDGKGGELEQQGYDQLDVFYPLDSLNYPFRGEFDGHVEDLEEFGVIESEWVGIGKGLCYFGNELNH